ncbi:prealbumin-like fold domain-containing protein [Microlunatus speluncae]|uniref:DUF7927 domain-containing protein n=1 Tax=Microlunatus speluncae TaxID=2594267 RepID=UPI00126659A0|nr:hypothetical protein [Microlunatus speluncae]
MSGRGQGRSTLPSRGATGDLRSRRGDRFRRILAGLAAVVIGLTTGVSPSLIDPQPARAARLDPISCGQLYAVGQHGNSRHIFTVDRDGGALTENNSVSLPGWPSLNALAVDAAGGAFWMAGQQSGQTGTMIVRVEAETGTQSTFAAPLPGAPAGNGGLVMGALNPDNGIYYYGMVSDSNVLSIWGFDTETLTPVPGIIGRVSLGSGRGGDFAFDSRGRLYVVSQGILLVLNEEIPAQGSPGPGPELAGKIIAAPPGNSVGSMAFGPDGYVYVAGETLYRLNPSTGAVAGSEELTPASASIADMASCASPNVITLVKDLPEGRHQPGDQFRLAITGGGLAGGNRGTTSGSRPGVQDRTAGAVAGPALGLSGTSYTITESAAGSTDLADYRSAWECVDRASGDVVAAGSGTSGRFELPASTARGAEIRCTFTNRPRAAGNGAPDVAVSQSVDPVSGSVVTPGQVINYRLTFRNTGTAAGPVAIDDVITGVLDDATLTSAPVSSHRSLTVSEVIDGRFTVSGLLAAGRTVTVGYAVKINPDGRRGDDVLRDFVVAADAAPPAECEADNLLCTENPVPALAVIKSVDPENGSEVAAGQRLSYALRFTNTGAAPVAVGFDEVIAGLLDDATLVTKPTSSDPSVTVSAVSDGRIRLAGSVNPGATVTVRYAVEVKPDGQRGDGRLAGFLIKTGDDTPSACRPRNPSCTAHPIDGSN